MCDVLHWPGVGLMAVASCIITRAMCRIYILRVATCSGEDEGLLEYINRYGSPFDK
jgi:hypothetical protein